MLDNGFPLATESNILKELIKPPTILRSVVNSITGKVKTYFIRTEQLKLYKQLSVAYNLSDY